MTHVYLDKDEMKICSHLIDSDEDWEANKDTIQALACFSHIESWEYILHIPDDEETLEDVLLELTGNCKYAYKEAMENCYTYICYYVG